MNINVPLCKESLKKSLMTDISEDPSFKKNFTSDPVEALKNRYGEKIFDMFDFFVDRDISGIIHIRISDKNTENKDDNIHLIMLDNNSK